MDRRKTLLVCGAILLAGAGLTFLIYLTEPTAQRVAATRESAMLVDVVSVSRGDYVPTILGMGTVQPAQDVILSPRVRGAVVARAEAFTPGGYVRKGEVLLQIDPADYENALRQRQGELYQALSDLHVEMGRQTVARKDYALLEEDLSGVSEDLVLRKPQLQAARARAEAARAAVRQAELALERTRIRAPFDAHILSRNANVGSQVAPGDNLGRLVGLDTYWVETTLPQDRLPWLAFPREGDKAGSEVRIRNRLAWPDGIYRTGRLHRLVGALDDRTRMARVLVTVPDPLAHLSGEPDRPPLMIGTFVETRIQARPVTDVVRLDRDHIRGNGTVWVMEDGQLRIRDIDTVFTDERFAYVRSGLDHGDRVVTTDLATVVEGAPLRVKGEQPEDRASVEATP